MDGDQRDSQRELQATIDALSSPVRREILWMLWDAELPAGEIAAGVHVTAGTVSTHLSVLRRAGLVRLRVDGNFRYYVADRAAMEAALPLLASSDDKWVMADGLPERELARSELAQWVTVLTEVPYDAATAYDAFLDETVFSAWLGVPVTVRDTSFSTQLEWGTQVRGRIEVKARPHLIAVTWDFEDWTTPVPGRQLVAYVRFYPTDDGCRVEIHQHAPDTEQAQFLTDALSMLLGRLKEYTDLAERPPRERRPKIQE